MADDVETDAALEALFAAARAQETPPGADLRNRVLQDARDEQDRWLAGPQRDLPPGAVPGLWVQVRQALGGWAGLSGLAAAGIAGVWLGFAPPGNWVDPASLLLSQSSYDLFQGEDVLALLSSEEG